MRIKRRDLFQNLEFMQQEMERLFSDMWGRHTSGLFCSHDSWRPPTDVYETPSALVIKMELAGMREKEIEIVLDDRSLIVSGTRPDKHPPECISYHQMGVNYGRFCLQIFLPWPVQEDAVSASYEDGFLKICLPRHQGEEEKVLRVEVRNEEATND